MSSSECPICFDHFPASVLARHASGCAGKSEVKESPKRRREDKEDKEVTSTPDEKRSRKEQGASSASVRSNVPLAEEMRPRELYDLLGQDEVTGPRSALRSLVESGRVPSLVLWGPPGCGKTSLANVLAQGCKRRADTRCVAHHWPLRIGHR